MTYYGRTYQLLTMHVYYTWPIMVGLTSYWPSMCIIHDLLWEDLPATDHPCVLYMTYYGRTYQLLTVHVYYTWPIMVRLTSYWPSMCIIHDLLWEDLPATDHPCVLYMTYYGRTYQLLTLHVYYTWHIMVRLISYWLCHARSIAGKSYHNGSCIIHMHSQ
jgi:hypothetical protein